jgi:hypothetical protein
MLVSKKYSVNDIVAFKLVSNDEVIARVVEETDTEYHLDTPCTVMPSQQGLGLIQSLFSADKDCKVTISKQHVLMSAPVIDQMRDHYSKTTTGIETVRKPGLIV